MKLSEGRQKILRESWRFELLSVKLQELYGQNPGEIVSVAWVRVNARFAS